MKMFINLYGVNVFPDEADEVDGNAYGLGVLAKITGANKNESPYSLDVKTGESWLEGFNGCPKLTKSEQMRLCEKLKVTDDDIDKMMESHEIPTDGDWVTDLLCEISKCIGE
jgi:hypothetical protein